MTFVLFSDCDSRHGHHVTTSKFQCQCSSMAGSGIWTTSSILNNK